MYGRHRYSRTRAPIMEATGIQVKRTKCFMCHQSINPGDPFVRLCLRKEHRNPCTKCHGPIKARRYHPACRPTDINKAMGFDPSQQPQAVNSSPSSCAPPPKPITADDAMLAALVAIENAIKARSRGNPAYIAQIEADFKTYQAIKAHVLRPGNPNEGAVAVRTALLRAVKLVF